MAREVKIKTNYKREISNLLALLIVVTIVIGVAIAVSGIGAKILMVMTPKGNDVVLSGFTWKWFERVDGTFTIYVRGIATNIGRMPVNITDVWLAYGGREYHLMFKKLKLEPSEYSEVSGKVVVDELPKASPITVFVKWCSPSKCDVSFTGARVESNIYLLREIYYTETITTTIPSPGTTTTVTITQPATTTTITATQTITQIVTATATVTATTTTTATITKTKPAWNIVWESCYGIDNYVYVWGILDKKVNRDAELPPYVLKVYKCGLFGCTFVGATPFGWYGDKSIKAKYGPITVSGLQSIKIEIWSVQNSQYIDKIYEETVDTSVRCA